MALDAPRSRRDVSCFGLRAEHININDRTINMDISRRTGNAMHPSDDGAHVSGH
jgi:hypothetical protein